MGLGVVIVDVNDDRRPDIYAVNDTTVNFLYINQSSPGKIRFKDVGLESGDAHGRRAPARRQHGGRCGRLRWCGRPSLWVTTFENERHALYQNECRAGPDLVSATSPKKPGSRHLARGSSVSAPALSTWTTPAGKTW